MMTDDELLHYARQILLSDVDVDGQERLRSAHVVVLGLGGLGSPLALYLLPLQFLSHALENYLAENLPLGQAIVTQCIEQLVSFNSFVAV